MISILIASVVSVTQFPGGKAIDLAKLVSEETKKPVVVVAYSSDKIAAFDFDSSDLKAFSVTLEKAIGHSLPPQRELAIFPAHLPRNKFSMQPLADQKSQYAMNTMKPGSVQDLFKSGSGTVQSKPNEYFTLKSLSTATLSKPLKLHWFFEEIPFVAWAPDVSEFELIALAARGVGAKAFNDPKSYTIEFDGSEFKYRFIQTYKKFVTEEAKKKLSKFEVDRLALLEQAVTMASMAQLAEAFKTPSSSTRISLGQSQKQQIFNNMMAWDQRQQQQGVEDQNRTIELVATELLVSGQQVSRTTRERRMNYSRLRNSIDFSSPMYLVLSANFEVAIEATSQPGRGGQRNPINF